MSQRRNPLWPPKEQKPRKLSGSRTLYSVSTLESGTAVPTDGESRHRFIQGKLPANETKGGKSLRFDDREGAFDLVEMRFLCVATGVPRGDPQDPTL